MAVMLMLSKLSLEGSFSVLSRKMMLSTLNLVMDLLGELRLLHSMLLILMLLIFTYFERIVKFKELDLEVKVPFSEVLFATEMLGANMSVRGLVSNTVMLTMKSWSDDLLLSSNLARSSVHCGIST